ncbi:MAG: hypothetical protein IKE85_06030 [Mogibacterium sp.]|nr:hypothetical protein [Mogibacterium sp.]
MKIIVVHDNYTNEPNIVRIDAINVIRRIFDKRDDGREEYSELVVGSYSFFTRETIGEIINKIKKAEVNADEEGE